MIKLIMAKAKNNVIGLNGKLPWSIKEELEFFKKMTLGSSLLLGSTTYEGLPPLTNRKMYVLSPDPSIASESVTVINTDTEINALFEKFENSKDVLWISGGKSIYEQFYSKATELYISIIDKNYEGDTKIKLDLSLYRREKFMKSSEFTVYKYEKSNFKKI